MEQLKFKLLQFNYELIFLYIIIFEIIYYCFDVKTDKNEFKNNVFFNLKNGMEISVLEYYDFKKLV